MDSITDPAAANEIYVVRITGVEVISALARRTRSGSISASNAATAMAQFKTDLQNEYQVIEITATVTDQAMLLAEKHALRGYDAVQLAGAYELNRLAISSALAPIAFVAADQSLLAAATSEGLTVDDPNSHP
jgi:uncharacterized protein